ncbi:hypothetical protein WA158_005919 [Blastocystis sp. Blastoise]
MVRDLTKERLVANSSLTDEGYVVFFGDNDKLRCSLSVERLKILWNDSFFYQSWLTSFIPTKNGVYIGKNDRNLDLIIEYMNGRPIYLDLKSKKELEELKEDFEYYQVEIPDQLINKLNTFSDDNDDSNGPIDDITYTRKEAMNIDNKMDSLTSNVSQVLLKLDQLTKDNIRLRNKNDEMMNKVQTVLSDNDELKKVIQQQNNEIINEVQKLSNDNDELKKVIQQQNNEINRIKNSIEYIKDGNDNQKNSLSIIKQDMNQFKDINDNINKIINDNKQMKEDINEVKKNTSNLSNNNIPSNSNVLNNNNNNNNNNIPSNSNVLNNNNNNISNNNNNISNNNNNISNNNNNISNNNNVNVIQKTESTANKVNKNVNNTSNNNAKDTNSSNEIKTNNSLESTNLHNQMNNLLKPYVITKSINFIDSIILNGNNEYINILNEWLGKEKQWKLLFRASEHEFKASEFHKYCDHKCPTITIIKNLGHNKIINIFGGYTTQYWESRSENFWKYDSGSFLFTLSNEHDILPTKYDILDPFNALYCVKNCGPHFMDICISDDCYYNKNSYINGTTNIYSHSLTPQFRSLFVNTSGPKQKNSFIVDEYEVYELIPNPHLYLPNSILINEEMGIELSKWFEGNKEWKLLYRCSDEKRSVKKWHEKCDDKESLVIIQGKGKDGQSYIFGGYTSVGWGKNHIDDTDEESEGVGWRKDSKAFLFSLTNPHGYNYTKLDINPENSINALLCNNSDYELSFCCGIYLRTLIDRDRFLNGRTNVLCKKNPVYISPYLELGNSFFANSNERDKPNIFDLIDFEVFTSQ